MSGLPASIIKKYGVSKKAWAVFRGTKRARKTKTYRTKSKARVYTMARKRRTSRKSKSQSTFKGGFMQKAMDVILGAGVAFIYDKWISPMIPISGMIKDIIELVLGIVVASMPRLPRAVRVGGLALAIMNAYSLISTYAG